jgi:hypothetical protein
VACPFFLPVSRLDQDAWIHPPRLPLSDPYQGVCHADHELFEPSEQSQRELCNCGYARGHCDRFPVESAADAVRFSITGEQEGIVELVYVVERNYAPVEYGQLQYSKAESRLTNPAIGEVLAAQARAFLGSYLRRAVV